MMNRANPFRVAAWCLALALPVAVAGSGAATAQTRLAEEQRVEVVVRNYEFLLNQPTPLRRGIPTVIVLRNQDRVRHGFTSPALVGLQVHGEGEGIASYGKGIEGFYVDQGKTLTLRFTTERSGKFSFKCDLHPQMKGEFVLLEIPTA